MINDFDIAKALSDQLSSVATLPVVTEGQDFDPNPDNGYIREFVLSAGESTVGLENTSSDDSSGIYQIDVLTPRKRTKWANLAVCDTIKKGFPKGRHISRNNQYVIVVDVSMSNTFIEDAYIRHSLSVEYRVVN